MGWVATVVLGKGQTPSHRGLSILGALLGVVVGYLLVFYAGIGILMLLGADDGEQQGYLFVAVLAGAIAGAVVGSRLLPHVLGRGRPR